MIESIDSLCLPFVDGLNRHELRYQRCADCNQAQTLARFACRRCGSSSLEWCLSSGRGTVFATTQVGRAPAKNFQSLAPYTLALVDLEEGTRIMGHAEPGIAVGDRVFAGFFEHDGRTLIKFVATTEGVQT